MFVVVFWILIFMKYFKKLIVLFGVFLVRIKLEVLFSVLVIVFLLFLIIGNGIIFS